MTHIKGLKRAMAALGAMLMAAALAGCMITSPTNLISESEAATPLPQSFAMYGYKADPDRAGTFLPNEDKPESYRLEGKSYRAVDNEEMALRFEPLTADTYILSAFSLTKDEAVIYGTMRLIDGVAELHIIVDDVSEAALASVKAAAPPAIAADITLDNGGWQVTRKDALLHLMGRVEDGSIPTEPFIAFVTANDRVTPPAAITLNGDTYRAQ